MSNLYGTSGGETLNGTLMMIILKGVMARRDLWGC